MAAASVRLLKHIVRCYLRLSDNFRAREALHEAGAPAQLDLERESIGALGRSDDYREGVEAFKAKRPPR